MSGMSGEIMRRLISDPAGGIVLIFAGTESAEPEMRAWQTADALLFLCGRPHLRRTNSEREQASIEAQPVLAAYGSEAAERLHNTQLRGRFMHLTRRASAA